jgi:hypothetical protein
MNEHLAPTSYSNTLLIHKIQYATADSNFTVTNPKVTGTIRTLSSRMSTALLGSALNPYNAMPSHSACDKTASIAWRTGYALQRKLLACGLGVNGHHSSHLGAHALHAEPQKICCVPNRQREAMGIYTAKTRRAYQTSLSSMHTPRSRYVSGAS